MIPEIEKIYNKNILNICGERYGFDPEKVGTHDGFESFVYEYDKDGKTYMVKITHTIRRSKEYLLGEIHFLNHLTSHGINTMKVLRSLNGNLIEVIVDDNRDDSEKGYFSAFVYEKLPGVDGEEDDFPEWSNSLYEEWGELMGKLHKASKSFKLPDPKYKRQVWFEEDLLDLEKYIPADQVEILEEGKRLIEEIKSLPTDSESYGVIHGDLHEGNLLYSEGNKLAVIDFDDCEYGHFISDISVAVWAASIFLMEKRDDNSDKYKNNLKSFLKSFFKGYRKENSLDKFWIDKLDKFLKLRELLNYSLIYQTGSYKKDSWQRYIKSFKEYFLSDKPFLKIDLEELNL